MHRDTEVSAAEGKEDLRGWVFKGNRWPLGLRPLDQSCKDLLKVPDPPLLSVVLSSFVPSLWAYLLVC